MSRAQVYDLADTLFRLTDNLPNYEPDAENKYVIPQLTDNDMTVLDQLKTAADELWRVCREMKVSEDTS